MGRGGGEGGGFVERNTTPFWSGGQLDGVLVIITLLNIQFFSERAAGGSV